MNPFRMASLSFAFLALCAAGASSVPERLLLSDARLALIREREKTDPLMAELLSKIRAAARENLTLPPNTYREPGDRNMLNQARAAASRIITSAFTYRLDGDSRHRDAARRDLLNVCGFPDWNPRHFLDVTEMGFGVALGYSWLREDLSGEEGAIIRTALVRNLLRMAPAAYDRSGRGRLNWSAFGSSAKTTNNWNFVCNGGFVAAALALRDEEPVLAETVLTGARDSIPSAMAGYAPDGAWPEGPTYWSYGTTFLVHALAMLENTPQGDEGLSQYPGFDRTLAYGLQLFGPSGVSFNFGDGGPARDHEAALPALVWLARRFGVPDALPEIRRRLQAKLRAAPSGYARSLPPGIGGRGLVLCAIFFPEQTAPGSGGKREPALSVPLDAHFRGEADFVVMRSHANDPDALWVALKGGANGVSHGHLDLGSFVLDAGGVRWAIDLGSENYSLPGYWEMKEGGRRWNYYRLNNHSHNTLTPGDALQSPTAVAPVTRFETSPEGGVATVDLTSAYPGMSDKMVRRVSMPGRKAVFIEDEVEGLRKGESLAWRMLTPARVSISPDGRVATLVHSGRKLRVELTVPVPAGAKFSTKPARAPTKEEKQNPGVSVLTVTFVPESPDVRLAVRFEPVSGSGE
ncbi:MAG: heparinase II/III-family protein [Opitutaceae bacterium]|nr:heparinase II/III-family protein [Opitutaceae bacterium]